MASPSRAEVDAQFKNAVAILENFDTSQTVAADTNTFQQSIESDFALALSSAAKTFRLRAAQAFDVGDRLLGPCISNYIQHIINEAPERSNLQRSITRLFQWMVDNSETVQSRAFTFGSPSAAGGNTSNGTVYRLTVDENGFDLEAQTDDQKTLRIVQDQNTGAIEHEEIFEIFGQPAGVDSLDRKGSGRAKRDSSTKAMTNRFSLLSNAGFFRYSSSNSFSSNLLTFSSGDTGLTDWTAGDVTQLQLTRVSGDFFKSIRGVTNPHGVRFLGNTTLEQAFSVNDIPLSRNQPMVVALGVMPESVATGSSAAVTLQWGSKSQAFTLDGNFTNDAWAWATADRDKDLWPLNFIQDGAVFKISVTGLASGENVVIAQAIFMPWVLFDGGWWAFLGGDTPAKLSDKWTATDSISSDSKIQKQMVLHTGRYLPHTTGTPTIADP